MRERCEAHRNQQVAIEQPALAHRLRQASGRALGQLRVHHFVLANRPADSEGNFKREARGLREADFFDSVVKIAGRVW